MTTLGSRLDMAAVYLELRDQNNAKQCHQEWIDGLARAAAQRSHS